MGKKHAKAKSGSVGLIHDELIGDKGETNNSGGHVHYGFLGTEAVRGKLRESKCGPKPHHFGNTRTLHVEARKSKYNYTGNLQRSGAKGERGLWRNCTRKSSHSTGRNCGKKTNCQNATRAIKLGGDFFVLTI